MPATWRDTRDRSKDGPLTPLPAPIPVPGGDVAVGQIWASNDGRDRRNGWRQARLVVAVGTHEGRACHAQLYTLPGKRHQSPSTCGVQDGRINNHRYVRQATQDELSACAGILSNLEERQRKQSERIERARSRQQHRRNAMLGATAIRHGAGDPHHNDAATNLADALTNIMYAAEAQGLSFDLALDAARDYYTEGI